MTVADDFRQLHHHDTPLLMPNAWDVGSARIFEHLGFAAIATTSSGSAATRGRLDGDMGAEDAFGHAADLVAATSLPVSADLEDGFAADPPGVAEAIRRAAAIGLAGGSVEDWDGSRLYGREEATERVRAAAEAAAGTFVLTARAENHIHGVDDLADTIARLQAYQEAGADVLFAPGLVTEEQIGTVVRAVDLPVNVLVVPGSPPVPVMARLGVRRLSVGGALAFAAYGAVVDAATELMAAGTYRYFDATRRGTTAARAAFGR